MILKLACLFAATFAMRVELDKRQKDTARDLNLSSMNFEPLDVEKLSASLSNEKVDVTNYEDLQYFGPVLIGSNKQKAEVVYDTGSYWLWTSAKGCTGCPAKTRFDSSTSTTYKDTGSTKELFYGKGYAKGPIGEDSVRLWSSQKEVTMDFLAVTEGKDLDGQQSAGILGLGPGNLDGSKSIVNLMHEEGIIDQAQFTFFIGKDGDQNSYIDFGHYKPADEIEWMDVYEESYWSVAIEDNFISQNETNIELENTKFAVLDTGTSFMYFEPNDAVKILKGVIPEGLEIKAEVTSGLFAVENCKGYDEFHDFNITLGDHVAVIEPQAYIIFQEKDKVCFFKIAAMNVEFALLGDAFLMNTPVVHDLTHKKIGLYPQEKIRWDGASSTLLIILIVVGVLLVGAGAGVFIVKYMKKRNAATNNYSEIITEREGEDAEGRF